MLAPTIIAACIAVHVGCVALADRLTRMFLIVLLLSHVYFSAGGYFYWVWLRDREFVGWVWDAGTMDRALILMSVSTAALAVIVTVANALRYRIPRPLWPEPELNISVKSVKYLAVVTLISCVFVLAITRTGGSEGSSFILIAYQFSDAMIPCILFSAAIGKKYRKLSIALSVIFVIYAVLVGFRYKLALLIVPFLLWIYFGNGTRIKKLAISSALAAATLVLFGAMTLYRVKFGGGLDFSRGDGGPADILYSFFAESNVVFAMTAIMNRFVDRGEFWYLIPFVDTLKELVPRFLWPGRDAGIYLQEMRMGMMTEEGFLSNTAHPLVGEFAIMGGYAGVIIGTIVYAALYVYLHGFIVKVAPSASMMRMGIALLATIMGYYHYSRGYSPQANKAYLFILAPYLALMLQTRGRLIQVISWSNARSALSGGPARRPGMSGARSIAPTASSARANPGSEGMTLAAGRRSISE